MRGGPGDLNTAVLFYILLECGYSNILARKSGGSPVGTQHLNRKGWRSRYAKLSRFSAPNLSVAHADCFAFLARFPDLFLYCDPPYASGSQDLYGFEEDLHANFPHERWAAALLAHKGGFVQSYGDTPLIRELYQGCVIDEASWYYGAKQGSSVGRELIIRPPGSPSLSALEVIRRGPRRSRRVRDVPAACLGVRLSAW